MQSRDIGHAEQEIGIVAIRTGAASQATLSYVN